MFILSGERIESIDVGKGKRGVGSANPDTQVETLSEARRQKREDEKDKGAHV